MGGEGAIWATHSWHMLQRFVRECAQDVLGRVSQKTEKAIGSVRLSALEVRRCVRKEIPRSMDERGFLLPRVCDCTARLKCHGWVAAHVSRLASGLAARRRDEASQGGAQARRAGQAAAAPRQAAGGMGEA